MSKLQNIIFVLIVAIAVQVRSTELQQLQTRGKLSIVKTQPHQHKSHGIIHLSTGSLLDSNPFLEQRWKLPILYFFDTTRDATARDSIRKSISYWESVTCARFEEVTNRTQVMTSLSPTKYVIFTASRVIGRQCITNVFSREHRGLAADEDDADIYKRVDGCLTLTATRQTDMRVGSTFYFYLNEQLPPFKDDFLEAIEENKPTRTETKVSMTENDDLIRTTSLYQLPGLSFNEVEALNSVYCQGCGRDDAENSTQCETMCPLPTMNIYTNDGCRDTLPSVDSECNITRTVTGKEECVTSPSLPFGLLHSQPRTWCPWHLKGRDGCRIMVTYTGRLRVARPCRGNTRIRKDSRGQQKAEAEEKEEDGSKLNANRQKKDVKAKSCDWTTRIGVNGSLLSSRQSASVVFRTRYAPDDQTKASSSSSSSNISSSSSSRGSSRLGKTDSRKGRRFYLQFTVCFRLVCDVVVGPSAFPPGEHPAAGTGSGKASFMPPPPHGGSTRQLLVRRTSPPPAPRILVQGQPITTPPTIDIRLFHLEQTSPYQFSQHPSLNRLVAMKGTLEGDEEGGWNIPVHEIVVGGLVVLALLMAIGVGVAIARTSPLSRQRSPPSS